MKCTIGIVIFLVVMIISFLVLVKNKLQIGLLC